RLWPGLPSDRDSHRVEFAANYLYAGGCEYEGHDEPALRICNALWEKYTVEKCRQPWTGASAIPDGYHPSCADQDSPALANGAALAMSYAAGGVQFDAAAGSARIRPADWLWKNDRMTLPVVLPRWLGQVKYSRDASSETYELTNLDPAIALKNIYLR